MKNKSINKIVIVGTGFVGSTTAYTLMVSGLVSEIVLIDQNTKKAEGEAMDMNHGMPFVRPVRIYKGDYEDCKGADIVVITGGANQKPGETRIDLVNKNTEIFKDIVGNIIRYNTDCILLVVTNPVDILTYVTYKLSGFPKNRVIGSGTVLDTARFKYMLGEHMGVDPRNVHAYIIGEHGDTEVPTWSLASIAGIPMDVYCKECKSCDNESFKSDTFDKVKNAAYEIIDRKNATYYAVALAVRRIVEAIVRNENSILTVSSLFEGEYGLNDICLSIPSQVNSEGISRILNVPLSNEETKLLNKSAQALKQVISGLNL
ncbi:L-lactate dehydrogenase [Ruminiclostridium papyrosolvens]|uniref:L-lactate dehydrogenase n=1 Tax=Ruminiclostridium papyrosolvens C7 TaxID=1330534 RepID=U4R271_9FIRM|nr:L-lactate dehydrogenase [Ruminiclostridium papyrosolvens]EPR11645.1 lactate dehydrogenase [Ruminiclostridium papyrosolvens C7]